MGLVVDGQVGRVSAKNQSKFAGPHAHVLHLWEDKGDGRKIQGLPVSTGTGRKRGCSRLVSPCTLWFLRPRGSGLPLGDSSFSGLGGNWETVTGATSSRQSLPTTEPGDSGPAGARKEESSPPRVS